MAKDKAGIKWYSQDSDHVLNSKVKLLYNEFDSHGPWIWECLKCEIYSKKGYYFDLNDHDELILFASDVCKKPVSLVKEIIAGCVRRGLFDQRVYDAFNILTSDRIQSNYFDGNREKRKKGPARIDVFIELLLIEIPENEKRIDLISLKNPNYREKIENSRENSDLYREKVDRREEIRRDEIREEERENKIKEDFTPPSFDDVLFFLKQKVNEINWTMDKCKVEAKNFVFYYSKTGWVTKNGPITNWQNAVNGWIANDDKFKNEKSTRQSKNEEHPNYYSKNHEAKISQKKQQEYWGHLRELGWVPKKDAQQNIIDWVRKDGSA